MNRPLLACAVALSCAAAMSSCASDSSKATATTVPAATATTTAAATTAPAPGGSVATATAASGSSRPPGSFPNPPACASLEVISQYDIDSSAKVAANDFPALTKFLIDSTPAVLAAYDEAATAEPDLADEIAILRKVSAGARDAAYEAKDMSALQTLLLDIPEIQQAGQAAITLNDYATKNCGFSTGNN